MFKKADIEGRIVNDQFRVFDEGEKVIDDFGETRLGFEVCTADTVDCLRTLVDVPIRIQEAVKIAPGQATVEQFDAADLDDAVALIFLCLCVQAARRSGS